MDNNTIETLFSTFSITFGLVVMIIQIIGMWRLFEKANEDGWKSLIPFYNTYILFKISWGNGWIFLALLIPFVNIIVGIMLAFKLGTAFNKSTLFKVGLLLLNPIFMVLLGFDDSSYIGPA